MATMPMTVADTVPKSGAAKGVGPAKVHRSRVAETYQQAAAIAAKMSEASTLFMVRSPQSGVGSEADRAPLPELDFRRHCFQARW